MDQRIKLKNGSLILIRELKEEDIEKSYAFFQMLPEEDRSYLRVDVTDKEIVARRIKEMKHWNVIRLVAIDGDNIVADAALEIGSHGWEKHIGELRLIVSPAYRRKGLGMVLANELYSIATTVRVEEMVVKIMKPQKAARKIFERLGFKEDVTLKNYVKDIKGERHDLIIFRCNLADLWQELEDYFHETDHKGIG